MVRKGQLSLEAMSIFQNKRNGGLGGTFGIVAYDLSNPRQSGVSDTFGLRARRSAWLSYEPVFVQFF